MEVVVQIVKQLPAGWPRVAALAGLVLLLLLPDARRLLTQGELRKKKLEKRKRLLELRKLELEVAGLKDKNADAEDSMLDAQIAALAIEPEEDRKPLEWRERAKFALMGSFSWMLVGLLALWFTDLFTGSELIKGALVELLVALVCGLIAAAIPSQSGSASTFRGFLIPAVVAALAVVARGHA